MLTVDIHFINNLIHELEVGKKKWDNTSVPTLKLMESELHAPSYRTVHTTTFDTPVIELWEEREKCFI